MTADEPSGSTITDAVHGTIPDPREGATEQHVDRGRLEQLVGQVVVDLGGAWIAPLVRIGDRLGLFAALAEGGTMTPDVLAERTGTVPRYVAEWLLAMAASGYVEHRGDDRYGLSPEQAALFTDPDSPAYVAGGFQLVTAGVRAADRLGEAFRTGEGMGWHEHHEDLFEGTERFFRPSYLAHLTSEWIPALTGLEQRLRSGAQVADVGCGLGASTRIMAQNYPASFFVGLDYHEQSIALARERAEADGLAHRVQFDVAPAGRADGPLRPRDPLRLRARHARPARCAASRPPRRPGRRVGAHGRTHQRRPRGGCPQPSWAPVRRGLGVPVPAQRVVGRASGRLGQPGRTCQNAGARR